MKKQPDMISPAENLYLSFKQQLETRDKVIALQEEMIHALEKQNASLNSLLDELFADITEPEK